MNLLFKFQVPKLVPKLIKASYKSRANFTITEGEIASHDNSFTNNAALLRLDTSEAQLKAKEALRRGLGDDYVVALPTLRQPHQNGYKKLVQNQ